MGSETGLVSSVGYISEERTTPDDIPPSSDCQSETSDESLVEEDPPSECTSESKKLPISIRSTDQLNALRVDQDEVLPVANLMDTDDERNCQFWKPKAVIPEISGVYEGGTVPPMVTTTGPTRSRSCRNTYSRIEIVFPSHVNDGKVRPNLTTIGRAPPYSIRSPISVIRKSSTRRTAQKTCSKVSPATILPQTPMPPCTGSGCRTCMQGFPDPSTLKAHLENVMDEPEKSSSSEAASTTTAPFVCEDCGASYHSKRPLDQHKKVHATGDKCPFKCDSCGEKFPSPAALATHTQEVHLHQNNFSRLTSDKDTAKSCSICGKHFPNFYFLASHLSTCKMKGTVRGGKVMFSLES